MCLPDVGKDLMCLPDVGKDLMCLPDVGKDLMCLPDVGKDLMCLPDVGKDVMLVNLRTGVYIYCTQRLSTSITTASSVTRSITSNMYNRQG